MKKIIILAALLTGCTVATTKIDPFYGITVIVQADDDKRDGRDG